MRSDGYSGVKSKRRDAPGSGATAKSAPPVCTSSKTSSFVPDKTRIRAVGMALRKSRTASGKTCPMKPCGTATVMGEDMASDERSEEHTSELQSLMRTSYAVFC